MRIVWLYAALLALLFVGLSFRTLVMRRRLRIVIGDAGDERERGLGEVRFPLAGAGQRAAQHLRDGDAQERRRHVRPVIDVLREELVAGGPLLPGEADRIDVQQ